MITPSLKLNQQKNLRENWFYVNIIEHKSLALAFKKRLQLKMRLT